MGNIYKYYGCNLQLPVDKPDIVRHVEALLGIQLMSDVESDSLLNEERQASELSAVDDNLSASCDDYQESGDEISGIGAARVPASCRYGKYL
jgi:hypothetical protein